MGEIVREFPHEGLGFHAGKDRGGFIFLLHEGLGGQVGGQEDRHDALGLAVAAP